MPPKETLIVNKVALEYKPSDHPQSFARVEQLYLELIENKTKIKQNLVNKDYEPPDTLMARSPSAGAATTAPRPSNLNQLLGGGSPATSSSSSSRGFLAGPSPKEPDSPAASLVSERLSKLDEQIQLHADDDDIAHPDFDTRSAASSSDDHKKRAGNALLSSKLQDLLSKRGNDPPAVRSATLDPANADARFEEYQRSRKRLPTLSELEQQGATTVRRELADAARLQIEDEDLKRELLFKFDLLRKSYRDQTTIPTFTIHSDLGMMTRAYEDTVRRLSLDSSVETYKRYLIGAFMLIEYALGKWLKLDMKGYTQQQIVSMSSYEKLLIEIGEKQYMPEGEQWSVEIRLVFLVIINTAFFLVGKMIMTNTGSNIMNAINNMNRANTEAPPKKKMQGPNINLDDLPDVTEMAG